MEPPSRDIRTFVKTCGRPFPAALDIDLKTGKKEEAAKWFLVSILYSKETG